MVLYVYDTVADCLVRLQLEWQSQAETASQTIAVLQDRLDASRTQLKQQDSIAEQLQADLQVSVGEIQFWKEQRTQETDKFKQVLYKVLCVFCTWPFAQLYVEFEELQRQNESLEVSACGPQSLHNVHGHTLGNCEVTKGRVVYCS